MGEGFLRCPTALGHYATHGTINSLQLSAPKYCHSCANSQRQILKYDNSKYVKLAEANT